MKKPRKMKRYCPSCKKHTIHDVDRIKTDDIMKPLYEELNFWQTQLNYAEIQEGTKSQSVRFVRWEQGY